MIATTTSSLEICQANELDALKAAYPQLKRVEVPANSGASRAWKVHLQPFTEDANTLSICRALMECSTLGISCGSLCEPSEKRSPEPMRSLARWLVDMHRVFEVIVLEFGENIQPQAFAISPEISRQKFPSYPHFRDDQVLKYMGRNICGLCYSYSLDHRYNGSYSALLQQLDFISYFLAKHMFWLRTRSVYINERAVRMLEPGEIADVEIGLGPEYSLQQRFFLKTLFHPNQLLYQCRGIWLGEEAPHDAQENLKLFREGPCHCGGAKRYGECHFAIDLAMHQKLMEPQNLYFAFLAATAQRIPGDFGHNRARCTHLENLQSLG